MYGVFSLVLAVLAQSESLVKVFEGNTYPEESGWERELGGTPGAERSIEDDWFVQKVGLPTGWQGPNGDADFYRVQLSDFAGAEAFFVEWRVDTDNPSWLLDLNTIPVVVSGGGNGAFYHTTITNGAVQLFRGTAFPLVIVGVQEHEAHTYRLETYSETSFIWYVDNVVVNIGTPRAIYPDPTSILIWGANRRYVDATTRWDYIRFGVIPEDGSGDFDSDGDVTLFDFYFFHDCLTKDGPGIYGGPNRDAGPGCRFADFDGNQSVDLLDFAEFQNLFNGSHP